VKDRQADLGGTVLKSPLKHLFSQRLSFSNQARKVIVLTDGCVFDKEEVFNLVRKYFEENTIYCLGIGYGADSELVKGLGTLSGGDYDFCLNGSDLRIKTLSLLKSSRN
jgi:hypothetical protein